MGKIRIQDPDLKHCSLVTFIFTVLTYASIGFSEKAIPVRIAVQQKDIYISLLYSSRV